MRKIFLVLPIVLLVHTSCTIAHQEGIRSDIPLENRTIRDNYGETTGHNTGFSILFWMCSRPDMQMALDDAKGKHKADALVNISFVERYYFFCLFSITTLSVKGEAVSLEPASKPSEVKK